MRTLPVPAPRRAGVVYCNCACHASGDADLTAAAHYMGMEQRRCAINGIVYVGVERVSVLEAAVACDICRRYHCPALSGRPAELGAAPRPAPTRILFGGDDGEDA